MSQSSSSLMRMTSVALSATICPIASPLTVSSSCSMPQRTQIGLFLRSDQNTIPLTIQP